MRQIPKVGIANGEVEVDARVIADGLGITPNVVQDEIREGKITSRCERGIDEDAGRHRLTFLGHNKRISLLIDDIR